jgi:hypothetical protein
MAKLRLRRYQADDAAKQEIAWSGSVGTLRLTAASIRVRVMV